MYPHFLCNEIEVTVYRIQRSKDRRQHISHSVTPHLGCPLRVMPRLTTLSQTYCFRLSQVKKIEGKFPQIEIKEPGTELAPELGFLCLSLPWLLWKPHCRGTCTTEHSFLTVQASPDLKSGCQTGCYLKAPLFHLWVAIFCLHTVFVSVCALIPSFKKKTKHFINLFYFWLCWIFIAASGLSLVVGSVDYSSEQCTGSRVHGFR